MLKAQESGVYLRANGNHGGGRPGQRTLPTEVAIAWGDGLGTGRGDGKPGDAQDRGLCGRVADSDTAEVGAPGGAEGREEGQAEADSRSSREVSFQEMAVIHPVTSLPWPPLAISTHGFLSHLQAGDPHETILQQI